MQFAYSISFVVIYLALIIWKTQSFIRVSLCFKAIFQYSNDIPKIFTCKNSLELSYFNSNYVLQRVVVEFLSSNSSSFNTRIRYPINLSEKNAILCFRVQQNHRMSIDIIKILRIQLYLMYLCKIKSTLGKNNSECINRKQL